MQMSGIDLNIYKEHSTSEASVSTAHRAQVPLHEILNKAEWSSARTCATYYDKRLDTSKDSVSHFEEAILKR